jgi:hypothetical protein
MIENYRTQRVWRLFMQNEEVQRGLQRAGFVGLAFVPVRPEAMPAQNAFSLSWDAINGRTYQVEYSPNLEAWFASPTGQLLATGPTASWIDNGPPATQLSPFAVSQRFYRVFQFGTP